MATDKDKDKDPPPYRGTTAAQAQQQRHPAEHTPAPPKHHEPERHPAQPPEAKPGVPQPDQQPKPEVEAEKPPEEKVLAKEEAMALFRGGHRLRVKGDPPNKWFAASRIHNEMVISKPIDEEVEKFVMGHELVLADDPPQH